MSCKIILSTEVQGSSLTSKWNAAMALLQAQSLHVHWPYSSGGVFNATLHAMFQRMFSMRVLFCCSLAKVCSCVSEPLILAMRVLFSCLHNVSSIDSKALLRFTGLLAVTQTSLFKVKA